MRVLMTIDAVGGVWRYAMDLARQLGQEDTTCLLIGCGPAPNATQRAECSRLLNVTLHWSELPLDWMVTEAAALADVPHTLVAMARDWRADLLHLNLPSQAVSMPENVPVVVTSHSCLATWWRAVKASALPTEWRWHHELTGQGLDRAHTVMVPTASHGMAITAIYGAVPHLQVVANATHFASSKHSKEAFVLAAGRWWDEGKNVATIDAAAARTCWPVRLAGALTRPTVPPVALQHADSLGSLPPDAMLEQMRRAAIFVSPALYEPFGLAVLEAAANGCALVLADIPTFRELWDRAAWFVDATDAAGFATAIDRLAASPADRQALGRCAAERAQAFTLSAQSASVRRIYQAAIGTHVMAD